MKQRRTVSNTPIVQYCIIENNLNYVCVKTVSLWFLNNFN